MSDTVPPAGHCAICRRWVGAEGYCRLYLPRGRVFLCSPACATRFLRGPARCAAAPDGDLLNELIEEWRWASGGLLTPPACDARNEDQIATAAK